MQKTEKLTTRNRRLPQIPSGPGQQQQPLPHGNGSAQGLTNSLFGFAKKLTTVATTPTTQHAQSVMRTSQSFTLPPLSRVGPKRPGRGAKLPQVPQGGLPPQAMPQNGAGNCSRRQLPNRDGYYSRSLEQDPQLLAGHHPVGQHQKLDTVLEAGRGVRKLPVPVVKTGTGRNGIINGGPSNGSAMVNSSNGMSQQQPQMPGSNTAYNHIHFDGEPMTVPGPGPMGPGPMGPTMQGMGPPGGPLSQQQQQQPPMMQDSLVTQGMVGSMPSDMNQMPNWT